MKYDLIAEFRDGSTECFEYSPKNWNRYTGNNDVVAIVTARTEETVFERVIAHVWKAEADSEKECYGGIKHV